MAFKNVNEFSLLMKKTFTGREETYIQLVYLVSNCEFFKFFTLRDLDFLFAHF